MSIPSLLWRGTIIALVAVLAEPAAAQPAVPSTAPVLAVAAAAPDTQPALAVPAAPAAPPTAAAASAPRLDSVTFFGEVRTRGEYDRPGSGTGGDGITMLRSRFGARAQFGGGTRLVVQLQDSRVFGQEPSTTAGSADQLDLHQGYLELGGRWRSRDLALRAGRQEIALGNERLIGAVGWSNAGRTFDGARLDLARGSAWRVAAFAATLAENGRRAPTASSGSTRGDASLFGVQLLRGGAEALLVHDRGVQFRSVDDVARTTAYVRYHSPTVSAASLALEGGYQFGSQRLTAGAATLSQDIGAWMAAARLSRNATAGLPAALTLGVDWLSGDVTPGDGRYGAFNTLYATNHKWYGTMDLFLDPAARTRDRGLVDGTAGAAVRLSPRASLRADVHGFWLATAAPAGVTADARALGWETDLMLPVQLSPNSGLDLGFGLYRPGAAAESFGLGEQGAFRQWGFAQLRVGF